VYDKSIDKMRNLVYNEGCNCVEIKSFYAFNEEIYKER